MKIFLDTANLESIKKFNDMGLLDGITTNPSLMSNKTTSLAKFFMAIYSAQLAPTAPAPTIVIFINKFVCFVFCLWLPHI